MASRLGAMVLSLVVAGCSSSPPRAVADALRRFDDLASFLPDDMQSYWFADVEGMETRMPDSMLRFARSGRNFDPPEGLGIGRHEFVVATDCRAGSDMLGLLEDPVVTDSIASHTVWAERDISGRPTGMAAVVEEHYLIQASSRVLLVQALARTGSRAAILGTFSPPPFVSPKARDVLLLHPRPEPRPTSSGLVLAFPSPITPVVAQLFSATKGVRLQIVTQPDSAIEQYYRFSSKFGDYRVSDRYRDAGRDAFDMHFPEYDWLILAELFGMNILI